MSGSRTEWLGSRFIVGALYKTRYWDFAKCSGRVRTGLRMGAIKCRAGFAELEFDDGTKHLRDFVAPQTLWEVEGHLKLDDDLFFANASAGETLPLKQQGCWSIELGRLEFDAAGFFEFFDIDPCELANDLPDREASLKRGQLPASASLSSREHEDAAHRVAEIVRQDKGSVSKALVQVREIVAARNRTPESIDRAVREAFNLMYDKRGFPISA